MKNKGSLKLEVIEGFDGDNAFGIFQFVQSFRWATAFWTLNDGHLKTCFKGGRGF